MSEEETKQLAAIVRLATLQEGTTKKLDELSVNIQKQSESFENTVKTQWDRIDSLRSDFNEHILTSSNQFTQYNTALKLIGIFGPLLGGVIAGIIQNFNFLSKMGGS